ncbi:hypothetical protein FE697_010350 [Mumia zhuanghuii]|uniref:RCC1 domain-containing protein n=2 Tax=Mumia TaxID=1546255 RepID=A0ABW1QQI0_9ACTN|nr:MULTISPECIES: Ig-like domain repeat protein [Mumia]KAA1423940.1 hypothetical protein FE697_010350 [Mumia zhuanghuii]
MITTLTRATAGLAATALAAAASLAVAPAANGDLAKPVPLESAGQVIGWSDTADFPPPPASLNGKAVVSITPAGGGILALAADGTVTGWGSSATFNKPALEVPAGLSGVVQIDASGANGLALKADGTVVAWGSKTSLINKVPTGLTNVIDVTMSNNTAFALKADGTIVGWGQLMAGRNLPPAGLEGVVDVTTGADGVAWALKANGTIVGWGDPLDENWLVVPDDLQGHIKRILHSGSFTVVLTDEDKLATFGSMSEVPEGLPAALQDEKIVDFSHDGSASIAVTASGEVYAWGGNQTVLNTIPASVDGKRVVAVTAASHGRAVLYSALAVARAPRISGSSLLGSTLTATAATFSGTPESTATQWLADGTPIAGATSTTLTLTTALLGKRISVEQTATQGSQTAKATSTATAPVARPQAASSLRASAATIRYGTTTPRVSVTITPTNATGRVDLYKGTRRLATGNATAGRATLTLPKTTLTPGTHTLTVRYAGNTTTKPSATTIRIAVLKANATITAKAKTKKVIAKKTKAKIAVTVRATGVRPGGTVAVYQGSKKVGSARLTSNGTAVVTLKKLTKAGKTKLTIRYLGSGTVNKATKTLKITVRKR